MALNYTLKRAAIMDGETEVATVRGLSLNDITDLISINAGAMEQLFAQFNGRDMESIAVDEVAHAGKDMLRSAPALMAQIIAIGSDAYKDRDPDAEESPLELIQQMPAGLQIACLEKIGEMTFTAFGGPKKVLALVLRAVQGLSQGVRET